MIIKKILKQLTPEKIKKEVEMVHCLTLFFDLIQSN